MEKLKIPSEIIKLSSNDEGMLSNQVSFFLNKGYVLTSYKIKRYLFKKKQYFAKLEPGPNLYDYLINEAIKDEYYEIIPELNKLKESIKLKIKNIL